jgi:hypothetical protein
MRKLTAAQSDSVASQSGLFSAAAWRGCVAYLHALLSDDDPVVDLDSWTHAMQAVKTFLDWALVQARARFGVLGHQCLLLASTKEMLPESEHQLHEARCVFSGRKRPVLYCSASQPEPCAVSVRVQRKFAWWAHHEQTGLECPHTSAAFVYESQYSFLVIGIYTLGHLGAILKQHSRACAANLSLKDFEELPVWRQLYLKLNAILRVVHASVL